MARRVHVILLLAVALALAGASTPVDAQTRPIAVALPDVFPDIDAKAIVLRGADRDVVLLRPDAATVDALAVSLLALRKARERDPSPATGEMIPITGFAVTEPHDGPERGRLAALLRRLERQPTTTVGTLGPGRWVTYRPH